MSKIKQSPVRSQNIHGLRHHEDEYVQWLYDCAFFNYSFNTAHSSNGWSLFFSFLCQRIWRRYYVIRMVSEQLHEDWRLLMNEPNIDLTTQWISRKMLRPFLFFITQPCSWYKGQRSKTVESILTCFKIILNSINSKGMSFLILLLLL